MKTTSYEISKKLAEIGFKAECAYLWFEPDQAIRVGDWITPINKIEIHNKEKITYLPDNNISYPAYDLETLIEALPDFINIWDGGNLEIAKDSIGYRISYGNPVDCDYDTLETYFINKDENESLTDTAARLLILLAEKGLINFKKNG